MFLRKVSRNGSLVCGARCSNDVKGFVLKADIRNYFECVDHSVLLRILSERVLDGDVLQLVTTILENYSSETPKKGMPLGNWTSQFFANVYLNELDQFVKRELKVKYYVRYVDDFIMFHDSRETLNRYKERIDCFLKELHLELHPKKCCITPLQRGVSFLGFRLFYQHTLVRRSNVRTIMRILKKEIAECGGTAVIFNRWNGWCAYAMYGNTHTLRSEIESGILN